MPLKRSEIVQVIYPPIETVRGRRFTQDTPITPDVWVVFGELGDLDKRVELLLTPHSDSDVPSLVQSLTKRLSQERNGEEVYLAYNESHVLADLTYRELIRAALPLSAWWKKHVEPYANAQTGTATQDSPSQYLSRSIQRLMRRPMLYELLYDPARLDERSKQSEDLLHFVRIASAVAYGKPMPAHPDEQPFEVAEHLQNALTMLRKLVSDLPADDLPAQPPLWSVFCNRQGLGALRESRLAVKADAAARLFNISCLGLRWAVIDSGIDACHPAFQRCSPIDPEHPPVFSPKTSRVVRTYDFTRLKELLTKNFVSDPQKRSVFDSMDPEEQNRIRKDLQQRLKNGQQLDWKLLEPFLRISDAAYYAPENEHGTHVGGILAADWRRPTLPPGKEPSPQWSEHLDCYYGDDLIGLCPDLELYDLRVFDAQGRGDEFSMIAALQFIRYLNSHKDKMAIHGVNLSFSLPHAVDSFACGCTPICEECERLVGSGVVVVAAAGNRGCRDNGQGQFADYASITITDPGNADGIITVGATHRFMPHKYGVSYFSSRGPTGDGRHKPDLVAPGEKIESCIPGAKRVALDGTSMAAPHVSGAAALLMARHRELIGKPARIKEILCHTATDLGRDRDFQGAGMLDVLRAIQSV